jgi:hypothetical protein
LNYFNAENIETLEDVFDIVQYKSHPAFDAVPFLGSVKKHPYDPEKCLILLLDAQARMPWFKKGEIIELKIKDVQALDELPCAIDLSGTTITSFRIWIRRGAIAVRFEPFEVTDDCYKPFDANIISGMLSQKDR